VHTEKEIFPGKVNTEPVAAKLLGAQAAGQTLSNGKEGDLPLPGMMINEPVSVYLLALKAAAAAGQIQAYSSSEKRGDLQIPGTFVNELVSVYLLAAPAAV
jgi:hypothetical protein